MGYFWLGLVAPSCTQICTWFGPNPDDPGLLERIEVEENPTGTNRGYRVERLETILNRRCARLPDFATPAFYFGHLEGRCGAEAGLCPLLCPTAFLRTRISSIGRSISSPGFKSTDPTGGGGILVGDHATIQQVMQVLVRCFWWPVSTMRCPGGERNMPGG